MNGRLTSGGVSSEAEWYTSGRYAEVAISARGGLVSKIVHSQIERGISTRDHFSKVLEVGALSGQHLPYVRHSFDEWVLTDIIDLAPSEAKFDDARVTFEVQDVHSLSYGPHSFDRVAAMCVVHHLDHPMRALVEMRRVCKPGGVLTILLPVDPGWASNLARRMTSMRRAKKLGLLEEARRCRALGHRNHFDSLHWQFNEVFKHDQVRVYSWPVARGGKLLNMFTSWHIVRSDLDK